MNTNQTDIGSVAEQQRLSAGAERFERAMGVAPTAFVDSFKDVAPDFGNYILKWEFADLQGRDGLDSRTREIAVIAACAALGEVGLPILKFHVAPALKAGLTRVEIAEILMQVGFAAGIPTAIAAMYAVRDAFAEIDRTATPAA
ncbi:carboxymuconolactone decarboxylase family protein [Caballeronia sp. LjRoot34]|uniref:carboxymuconolactone decarboxylase family protein n=1 Tax=Caballeronia sp. LjRoot34 TaxID=3342325 RepID=UPI003ECFDF18